MPASQLKRLKNSLREQGVTGPQKSKKQKKQQSSQKTNSDRNSRNAALQQIRDSFNPFELKATSARPQKFHSASVNRTGKYREVLHRPGVTKGAGEEMRRNTLLPEMRRRNKVGGVVDRRIGEGDVDMTPEDRAVQRFAREKERKAKGRSMFDLEGSDNEGTGAGGFGLTHGGRRLDDLEADDFGEMSGVDESEDDGELLKRKRRRSDVDDEEDDNDLSAGEEQTDEQPERKRSKKEVMQEVIAKSKLHKYERQKAKEDDDDLREELDQDFGEILSMLKNAKRPQPPAKPDTTPATNGSGPVINPDRQRLLNGMDRSKVDKEYDVQLKQLATDTRAKPSDRSKTAEEKAQEEAKRLQELEEKRQKRMRGENVSDDEAPKDDAEAGADEDILDQAEEFGFTNSDAQPKQKNEQLVLDDEDEFALDDDLVASDEEVEDVELSDDQSDDEEDEDDVAPPENEEDEFVKDILGQDVAEASTGANNTSLGERGATSKLVYTYPCPRSHAELLEVVKDVSIEQLTTIIQRIRALYHPSLSASNKESMGDFACALVDHLAYMGNGRQSMAVAEQVIRHLHSLSRTYPTQIGEQFRKQLASFHVRGQPTAGDMIILTAIGSIYPTSDHWHQVVTPATTLMARWLGLNAPTASKAAEAKTLTTGAFFIGLCLKYQSLSKRYVPEAARFSLRALASKGVEKAVLEAHLTSLTAMAELWKDKSAFTEIFAPALPILKSLSAKKEQQTLKILLQQARLRRRPLELHHHRKQPIRTSVPKFEENFDPNKHYDPDKERSDAKKMQKEFKREKKGALRELRKDANFIAREQLREKREKDAEHERKERRLIAEINAEEGREANEYKREVAKRQRMKKK